MHENAIEERTVSCTHRGDWQTRCSRAAISLSLTITTKYVLLRKPKYR